MLDTHTHTVTHLFGSPAHGCSFGCLGRSGSADLVKGGFICPIGLLQIPLNNNAHGSRSSPHHGVVGVIRDPSCDEPLNLLVL